MPTGEELAAHYAQYRREVCPSAITRSRYENLLEGFERVRSTNRILDLGCGSGDFLDVALARGWNASGSEFDEAAIGFCRERGIEMASAPLSADAFPEACFDVVTAFEVAEHLAYPADELGGAVRFLRPGGLLYVTTPNFASLSRRVLGARWDVIEYPEHLGYFTARTLDVLLRNLGLERVVTRTHGFSPGHVRSSLAGQAKPAAHGADERLRETLEGQAALRSVKTGVNALLNATRLGDSIKASYTKSAGGERSSP